MVERAIEIQLNGKDLVGMILKWWLMFEKEDIQDQ